MQNRIFKTKLNIKSKKVSEAFKKMAGIYRKIFNVGLDIQFYRATYNAVENHLIDADFLYKVVKVGEKECYPYISKVENGISRKASDHSKYSFWRWYKMKETRLPVYKARKEGMSFATNTRIKVFYDHIHIPKVGKVKLYEKGYIPQGKVYKNVSFSYDGKNWWISLEACEKVECCPKKDLKGTVKVTSDMQGNVAIGDVTFANVIEKDNYKALKKKRAKLVKKMKRQKEANTSYPYGKKIVRTSRNMVKTRNRIQLISSKMKEIKKDAFRKIASEVARTKPKELQMLSLNDVRLNRQAYLSRYLRESGTRELLSMIKRRAESIGSKVTRYSEMSTS